MCRSGLVSDGRRIEEGNVLRARGGSFRSWTGLIHRLFCRSGGRLLAEESQREGRTYGMAADVHPSHGTGCSVGIFALDFAFYAGHCWCWGDVVRLWGESGMWWDVEWRDPLARLLTRLDFTTLTSTL